MLFRWFWAQERFLFWQFAPKFEIIGRLGRNFFPSCTQWLQGTCCKQKCGGKVFLFLRALVSVYYRTFSFCAIPNKLFSLMDSKSRGFQTRENWWKHEAVGRVLLLFSSVWNPRWNTKREFLKVLLNRASLTKNDEKILTDFGIVRGI